MDIKKIDKNFDTTFALPEDVEWYSIRENPFSIHGIFYSEEERLFRRLPKGIADATNMGVSHLSKNTAGGRVRFMTDSPYIVVRMVEPYESPFSHMTIAGKCGVSIFANEEFVGTIFPSYEQIANADPARCGNGKIVFDGIKHLYLINGEAYQVEIFLPLYSALNEMCIGLKKGCVLKKPKEYKHKRPILFYGSSITQGGCASKPGDDYINRLSRKLNFDYINLGFSGSAFAEPVMAKYLANQNPSVFVLDYDHNAPTIEHLVKTHFSLYKTVREVHPITPIIMMTMPMIEGHENMDWYFPRKQEILKNFEKAKNDGDENLYLVNCYGCFGEQVGGECGTIDDTHPDSLGFLRMAERLYPVLNKILNT